jgi:hypothetical protein
MIRHGAAALAMAGLVLAGCASGQPNGSAAGGRSAVGSGTNTGSDSTTGPSIGGPASVSPSPSGGAPADNLSPGQLAAIAATCPSDQNFPQANGPTARAVPATLQASWVLRCTISTKGGSRLLVAEHSVGDTAPLLRALKAPSGLRIKVVCPMLRMVIPYFALVEPDGTVFVPKVPLSNCGMPQNPVTVALNALRYTTLSSKPIG